MPSANIEWNKMVGYGMGVFDLLCWWRYIEFYTEYTVVLKLWLYIMLHDFIPLILFSGQLLQV